MNQRYTAVMICLDAATAHEPKLFSVVPAVWRGQQYTFSMSTDSNSNIRFFYQLYTLVNITNTASRGSWLKAKQFTYSTNFGQPSS